jgi:hypothetical protein
MPERTLHADLSLVSDEMNEVLGATPHWITRWGSLLLLGAIVLLLLVSALIKYPDVINGTIEIVPLQGQRYVATALVPAAGSGKIQPGQPVIINLDSYPQAEFGNISGKVASRPLPAAGNRVKVMIALDNSLVTSYHKKLDLYKQEQGRAEIITTRKRLIRRIFSFFR